MVKVANKDLSTNDFTDEFKTKLENLENISSETFVVKVANKDLSTNDFTDEFKTKLENLENISSETFVVKVTGKDLSTNDFTDELKNKLANIESNAEKNILNGITINGTPAEISTDTRIANITIENTGGGGGLAFVISNTKPEGTNILWLKVDI